MFEKEEIMEFIDRIINTEKIDEKDVIQNVTKFYEYLVLTKMCDEDTLGKIYRIISCINEIMVIRKTMGYIDINSLLLPKEEQKKLVKKPKKNRHYDHYETSIPISYSSSCGSSSYTSRC